MKKAGVLLALCLLGIQPSAEAFIIDGSISDWGVNISVNAAKNKFYLDTHLPSGGNDIDYVTEDNADINSGTAFIGPGYSAGNNYDAEALYIDNDDQYLYLALVTGVGASEGLYPSGDLFLDTGHYQDPTSPAFNATKYGFGIDINQKKLYAVNSWNNVVFAQHAASNPWTIGANRIFLSDVDLVYSAILKSHYVIEARIPVSYFNLPYNSDSDIWAHWTMKCGNDELDLHGDYNPSAPEPATMGLLSLGLMGMGFARRKKSV